jgi:hypothetical protein
MAIWYLAQPQEFLIDLDDITRRFRSKSGEDRCSWGEMFRRRLRAGILAERIPFCRMKLVQSTSKGHWHAVILLAEPMSLEQRLAWQLQLLSDLMRAKSDLMRAAVGIEFPSLLIRQTPIKGFWRKPDRVCRCTRKHDTEQQYLLGEKACPVWRELRGMTPWELFGEPYHGEERGEVKLPEGEVPLELILKIATE